MSSTEVLTWTKPSTSVEQGNWADLVTLDLSKFDQPGGKQELAVEFTRAIEEVGIANPHPPIFSWVLCLLNFIPRLLLTDKCVCNIKDSSTLRISV